MKAFQTDVRYNTQSVSVPLPHTSYVDKVLRSNSYEELMWRFMEADHPAKEITESYAAFSNLKKVCRINHFNWLHIGDGGYTRTAAIFAFFSKTMNWSIDPALNIDKFNTWKLKHHVEGIVPVKLKYQDIPNDKKAQFFTLGRPYNIVCVHAHVNLEEVDKELPHWQYMYSNPCCYPKKQSFSEEYMKENKIVKIVDKYDLGILSERRQIYIYKNLR